MTAAQDQPRLLMIGLDALPPALLQQCMDDGILPNLTALRAEGRMGTVSSRADMFPASVWPTFFTQSDVGEHGIHHLSQWDPESERLRPAGGDFCPVTPFWHGLAEAGVPVIALDVPFSDSGKSPPGAVEVVGWGMHEGVWRASRPAGLVERLDKSHGRTALEREGPGERTDEFIARELPDIISDVGRRVAIIEDLAKSFDWRLFIAVFSEAHRAGHWFWGERGTGVPQGGVKAVLKAIDENLPRLRALLRPQDYLVVFAVHGMERTYDSDRLGVAAVQHLTGDHARRLVPTTDPVLALRSLMPVGLAREIARRLPQGLYNWAYYRLQNSRSVHSGAPWVIRALDHVIYAYVRDRGLTPEQRKASVDEVEAAFRSVRTADGRPVIEDTLRPASTFEGARAHLLPDLIVRAYHRPMGADLIMPDGVRRTFPRNASRDGEHHPLGFFIQAGPGIEPGVSDGEVAGQDLARMLCAPAGFDL